LKELDIFGGKENEECIDGRMQVKEKKMDKGI